MATNPYQSPAGDREPISDLGPIAASGSLRRGLLTTLLLSILLGSFMGALFGAMGAAVLGAIFAGFGVPPDPDSSNPPGGLLDLIFYGALFGGVIGSVTGLLPGLVLGLLAMSRRIAQGWAFVGLSVVMSAWIGGCVGAAGGDDLASLFRDAIGALYWPIIGAVIGTVAGASGGLVLGRSLRRVCWCSTPLSEAKIEAGKCETAFQ